MSSSNINIIFTQAGSLILGERGIKCIAKAKFGYVNAEDWYRPSVTTTAMRGPIIAECLLSCETLTHGWASTIYKFKPSEIVWSNGETGVYYDEVGLYTEDDQLVGIAAVDWAVPMSEAFSFKLELAGETSQ